MFQILCTKIHLTFEDEKSKLYFSTLDAQSQIEILNLHNKQNESKLEFPNAKRKIAPTFDNFDSF